MEYTVRCCVIVKRVNRGAGYGLEISVTYTLHGPQKPIEWVKKAVEHETKLTNDMKKKCLKRNMKYEIKKFLLFVCLLVRFSLTVI